MMRRALLLLVAMAIVTAAADPGALPAPGAMTMPPLPSAIAGLPQPLATSAAMSMEQRRELALVANADKLDEANRQLLARNQELQVQLESLDTQVKVLQNDRSTQAMWNGVGAVVIGFLLGIVFVNASQRWRRNSNW